MSISLVENSFCKNCDNLMDITNNISSTLVEIQSDEIQTGGNNVSDIMGDIEVESSDYDVSMSESINEFGNKLDGGAGSDNISENDISNLLDGSDTNVSLPKNFNINDLNKNSKFNKLSIDQKTLVVNRILENVPKQKQSKSNNQSNKKSYFYCKSCGYNEKIPNKKFIFSRGNENKNEIFNSNFINFVNDNTLPRTKNYNCINPNCSSHSNPEVKMAVFYRHSGSYNVRYICQICNKYWDIYNDTKNI